MFTFFLQKPRQKRYNYIMILKHYYCFFIEATYFEGVNPSCFLK